jgi:hypothetical protein
MCAEPRTFIQLGRYGDLILLFPAFQRIHELTGQRPTVIVSTDFATVFEGISYAKPFSVHWDFYGGMPQARALAHDQFGEFTILQCNGAGWDAGVPDCPNYMTSMWRRTGFSDDEMRTLPLTFDRRDAGREKMLIQLHRRRPRLPLLLVNFTGNTSPFPGAAEVMNAILERRDRFDIVDMGKIRATRIYDLLGLYDAAVGIVTSDTATLHLAAASPTPYVGYTAMGCSSSVVKGNCVLEVKYRDVIHRMGAFKSLLDQWASRSPTPQSVVMGGQGALAV